MATSSDEMIPQQLLMASSTADAMGSDEFMERVSVRLEVA